MAIANAADPLKMNKLILITISFNLILSLGCSSFSDNKAEFTLFRNGTKCDSTFVRYNKNKDKVSSCFKDGTESYLITNTDGDTIYMKRHINPLFFEKLIYEDNQLVSASLNMQIKDLDENDFANNVLNFVIKNNRIDKDSSFFYELKSNNDTVFFRPNIEYDYSIPLDSIWISDWQDYFPLFNQISDVEYPIKSKNIDKWNIAYTIPLTDSIKTILLHYTPKDSINTLATDVRYISKTIINWNKEILNRFEKTTHNTRL